jgi:flagellar L-ring protein precursor FlgH
MTNHSHGAAHRVLIAAAVFAVTTYCVWSQQIPTPPALKKILKKFEEPSALDEYVEQAHRRASASEAASPGSLYSGPAILSNLAIDERARSIDDIVTIVVNEQASAVSTGSTKTSRASSVNAAVTSLAGTLPAAGKLANLANANSSTTLNGQGTTSRQTTLTTTITARVTDVLPNGYLVIEGHRVVLVNSENQVVTIRGVVRPADLTNGNTVPSGSVAQMELRINGRGVVNDVIHRPNFIYRLILGLLPF